MTIRWAGDTLVIDDTEAGSIRRGAGAWWALTPDGDAIRCESRDEALATLVSVHQYWEGRE